MPFNAINDLKAKSKAEVFLEHKKETKLATTLFAMNSKIDLFVLLSNVPMQKHGVINKMIFSPTINLSSKTKFEVDSLSSNYY